MSDTTARVDLYGLRLPRLRFKLGERLVDALADPRRRDKVVLGLIVAYAAVWTLYGIVTKSVHDMQYDAAEIVAWSHHLALGYTKHPPLAAWIVRAWFTIFPIADWSYYLLDMSYAAFGLWIAWHLFGRLLDADKRIAALVLLTFVPYYNFFALRFDHNAVLGPLWGATALCFFRSFATRSAPWAALAGIAAAAAMLGKYWSIFLLAGLVLAALVDARRGAYFRSAAPWITVLVGAAALAPHVIWLVHNEYISFNYALDVHEMGSVGHTAMGVLRYLGGAVGYAAVPLIAVVLLGAPNAAAFADMLLPRAPERRIVAVTFWTALLLPVPVAFVLHYEINPIWTLADFILLPLVLLASPLLTGRREVLAPMVGFAAVLPLGLLALSPAIALAIHLQGVDPSELYPRLLSQRVEAEWHHTTAKPLRVVGGDFGLANSVAFYLPEQPAPYAVREPEDAPWVTPASIVRDGAVMVCHIFDNDHACTPLLQQAIDKAIAGNPPPRHVEVTLTRDFLGIAGKPQRYLILIAPPAQ